jgi:hypothetical protein
MGATSESIRPTVSGALRGLEQAFLDLNGDGKDPTRWRRLQRALRPFAHPLDGGVFEIIELQESFSELISAGVIRRVFELRDVQPNKNNASAVEAAGIVCTRVLECIECAREVHALCRMECGSPTIPAQKCS